MKHLGTHLSFAATLLLMTIVYQAVNDDNGGNLDSNRKYSEKLFGHMFYPWCNSPLMLYPSGYPPVMPSSGGH